MSSAKKKSKPLEATLVIKRLKVADLLPHPSNPRNHPEPGTPEWNALKASLVDLYFDPLIVNSRNRMLVSGHLRQKVFMEMGVTHADCVVIDVDEDRHIALLMRANNASGEFDFKAVSGLLKELDAQKFDLALTGFDSEKMQELLAEIPTTPVIGHLRRQSDEFSKFEVILKHDNKLRLVKVLDEIRERENLDAIEDALMKLCDCWNK